LSDAFYFTYLGQSEKARLKSRCGP